MQFSYLEGVDPLDTIMGTLIHNISHRIQESRAPVEETVPEVELSDDWKTFSATLAEYQKRYISSIKELRDTETELKRKKAELNALLGAEQQVQNRELKTSLSQLITAHQERENIQEFEQTVKVLKGQTQAMKHVLENTNPEQILKYQCFVCMDKSIDTFLDPCGHVLCSGCWRRNRNGVCPACRNVAEPKKIYLLS